MFPCIGAILHKCTFDYLLDLRRPLQKEGGSGRLAVHLEPKIKCIETAPIIRRGRGRLVRRTIGRDRSWGGRGHFRRGRAWLLRRGVGRDIRRRRRGCGRRVVNRQISWGRGGGRDGTYGGCGSGHLCGTGGWVARWGGGRVNGRCRAWGLGRLASRMFRRSGSSRSGRRLFSGSTRRSMAIPVRNSICSPTVLSTTQGGSYSRAKTSSPCNIAPSRRNIIINTIYPHFNLLCGVGWSVRANNKTKKKRGRKAKRNSSRRNKLLK